MPKTTPPAKPQPQAEGTKKKGKKGNGTPTLPPPRKLDDNRPVVYHDLMVNGVVIPKEKTVIGVQMAKQLLDWHSEREWALKWLQEQHASGNQDVTIDQYTFPKEGDPLKPPDGRVIPMPAVLLKDHKGERIVCLNNTNNREIKERVYLGYAQDILNKVWRMNCENIIIGKTGRVISGQHRLIALILAGQMWEDKAGQGDHWRARWDREPYIESLVACGCDEDLETIRTIDNVSPRTLTDALFTSTTFQGLDREGRSECSRYLAYAIDLLWKRTWAGSKDNNPYDAIQTHSTSFEFLSRHPKLVDCVVFIHGLNKGGTGRPISNIQLSAGHCAAMLYFQGSSATPDANCDEYRKSEPPTEDKLTWERWDLACRFWKQMVVDFAGKVGDGSKVVRGPVGRALEALQDPDTNKPGRLAEKHAVLVKAWDAWVDGGGKPEALTYEAVALVPYKDDVTESDYQRDDQGRFHLKNAWVFGGVDLGPRMPTPKATEPSVTQLEEAKRREMEDRHALIKKQHEALKKRKAEAAAKNQPQTMQTKLPDGTVVERPLTPAEIATQHGTQQGAQEPAAADQLESATDGDEVIDEGEPEEEQQGV